MTNRPEHIEHSPAARAILTEREKAIRNGDQKRANALWNAFVSQVATDLSEERNRSVWQEQVLTTLRNRDVDIYV